MSFSHAELVEFACSRFSGSGLNRNVIKGYFNAWAYEGLNAERIEDVLDFVDADLIDQWWADQPSIPAHPKDDYVAAPSGGQITGNCIASLMGNLNR